MSYAEVLEAARSLPEEEQARLIGELSPNFDVEPPPGLLGGEEFDAELRRRLQAHRDGTAKTLTWDEVRESAVARLNDVRSERCVG